MDVTALALVPAAALEGGAAAHDRGAAVDLDLEDPEIEVLVGATVAPAPPDLEVPVELIAPVEVPGLEALGDDERALAHLHTTCSSR